MTGVTYSILSFRVEGNEVNIVKAGILKIDISGNNPVTLQEAYPISTDKGMEGTPYTFTVSNTGDIDAVYRIYLDDVELDAGIERLSDSSIRYSLTKDDKYLTDTVADLLSSREDRIIATMVQSTPEKLLTMNLKCGSMRMLVMKNRAKLSKVR